MADFFNISETGIITIRPEAKQIPEIKALIEKYKPDTLEKITQYIWHMTSTKSPYEGYPNDKREQQVIRDYIKDTSWQPDAQTKAVVTLYSSVIDSPAKRLLKAARKAVDEIAVYLNNSETDTETKAKLLEKVPKIVEGLDKCEERVKKEIATEEKIRGGGQTFARER